MIAPRVCHVPPAVSGSGGEAVELAAAAGVILDPWQAFVVENALGETGDGAWSAFTVGLAAPRQQGKSEIAVVRLLAGLVLFNEPLQVYSSHLFDSAVEIHRRLASILEENGDLSRKVKSISRAHGSEGVEMLNGCRVRFRARGSGGGRGFSPSCLIFDEAMFLPTEVFADLVPAVSAQSKQQIWLMGSAPDQDVHRDAVVFARLRERAIAGDAGALAWFEWSVPYDKLGMPEEAASDPAMLEMANPAVETGRLTLEQIARERDALDLATFAVERCGAGDWPKGDGRRGVIPAESWERCGDIASEPQGPLIFGVDTSADRRSTAIAVAGFRADDDLHVEVVDVCATADAPLRLADLVGKHNPAAVIADSAGPTAALLPALESLAIKVTLTTAGDHAQAAAMLYDRIIARTVRYRPATQWSAELDHAVAAATKRPLGDGGFGWSRKGSSASIAPLVAITLAGWGCATRFTYDGPLFEVIC